MCEAECQSCKQKQLICDQERGELRMENHDLMSRVLKLERQLERAGRSDDDDRDHDRDDEKT